MKGPVAYCLAALTPIGKFICPAAEGIPSLVLEFQCRQDQQPSKKPPGLQHQVETAETQSHGLINGQISWTFHRETVINGLLGAQPNKSFTQLCSLENLDGSNLTVNL